MKKTIAFFTFIATLTGMMIITINSQVSAFAQDSLFNQTFLAILTGDEQVPPTDTDAKGVAELQSVGIERANYTLNVFNIDKVNASHIHKGRPGEIGPIVAILFSSDHPTPTLNGVLSEGTAKASDPTGGNGGKQPFFDLATHMQNGSAYIDIHTEDHPMGEIRGQILNFTR